MSVDTGDQPTAVTWYGESRVGPELGGGAVRRQLVRALESHYSLGVAEGDELVRPDARVGLGVVDQTRVAVSLKRITVDTFDVTGAATVALRVHTELVFATRAANRRIVGLAIAAIDGPIIIAMIMNGTVSVKQKSVLAVFESQRAVRAQEEGPAIFRVSVSMNPVRIGAWRGIE